ncbi:hypothetical protein CH253_04300 [Rhodococcus sp. 06-156-3C]|nr:hypothetical protein CH280_08280 [Rhodococcus sp. 06-156-4C]OZD21391.1 hypothetical protein CH248_09745 [Rhodococcus sp. 06-156-4a]OZD24062.1 hypothetical protein CH247_29265 [Rhodococcus sp. 06-156-3b]OZD25235.1 hypothetical protein CH253_04300 [Rhodococcus sp. 06-156-3C]OZD40179.1 hypothetical protein CH284_04025 [Rhodococcus sp. 06-156-3]OZF66692.1 hypothetical protein CH290_07910 [Rhodococcus sp. 06-156-4]
MRGPGVRQQPSADADGHSYRRCLRLRSRPVLDWLRENIHHTSRRFRPEHQRHLRHQPHRVAAADRGAGNSVGDDRQGSGFRSCGRSRTASVHRADSGVGVRMSTRTAILATVVAVVTFSAAAYTVVTTGPDDDFGYEGSTLGVAYFGGGGDFGGDDGFDTGSFSPTVEPEPTASPGAPHPDWTLTTSSVSDVPGAGFYDPVTAGELVFRSSGFIEAGDVLITLLGVESEYGFELSDSSFVAVDSTDGSVRWQTPAAGISGSASEAISGKIVCHTNRFAGDSAFVAVDVATGELTSTPTEWFVDMIGGINDRLYVVEGDIEGNDLRVHSGTPSDPSAYWTSQLTIGGYGEDASMFVLSLDHGIGFVDTYSDAAIFDLATGFVPWQKTNYDDCVDADAALAGGIVIVQPVVCDEFEPVATEALDSTGRVFARTDGTATHHLVIDAPDGSAPFLMGDSAYDRATGRTLWTSSSLVAESGEGTAVAVVGETVLLSDGSEQKFAALDLRTGSELWSKEGAFAPSARNGNVLAGLDGDVVTALDIETGEGWTLPASLVGDSQDLLSGDETVRTSDGRFVYASPAEIVALTPA